MGTAWDIYAHRLMHLGYGHPLWRPEPSSTFGEIHVGDVGYLRDGRFCFLFNAMLSADDEVNSKQGVPDNFVTFSVPRPPLYWENEITDTQLHSKTVRSVEVEATVSANGGVLGTASVGLRYQCAADSGALLLLKQPAHKTALDCPIHIKKYMMTHLPSWRDFANDTLGIGLEDKDIVFVSGFLKTTVWGTAAFSNVSDSAELVIAGGCFVPSDSGAFRVSIARGVEASVASRAGPQDRISAWNDGLSQSIEHDQCIFLSYYKMKYRRMTRLPRIMRAAAGPHTLPQDDGDNDQLAPLISSSNSTNNSTFSDSQESECTQTVYDPVNEILDYILKDPAVEVACAEVRDLSRLFTTNADIPNDIPAMLESLAPHVIRDQSGVGMIGFLPQVGSKGKVPTPWSIPVSLVDPSPNCGNLLPDSSHYLSPPNASPTKDKGTTADITHNGMKLPKPRTNNLPPPAVGGHPVDVAIPRERQTRTRKFLKPITDFLKFCARRRQVSVSNRPQSDSPPPQSDSTRPWSNYSPPDSEFTEVCTEHEF